MSKKKYRIEKDTMGEIEVPADALYGAQTARAIGNFPVSGLLLPRNFIYALALIKKNAAIVNGELGLLDATLMKAIVQSTDEIIDGRWDGQFQVDVFQTGSGTSTNMNMNEVISNRANQILGHQIGDKHPVHPNDHVNMGQSSNDVIPSAMHIATVNDVCNRLQPELHSLIKILKNKEQKFKNIIKIGRTHLQDATPITLGMEFSGYRSQMEDCEKMIKSSIQNLKFLALGGTAIGTGINTHKGFRGKVIEKISEEMALPFFETDNHFKSQSSMDAAVYFSGVLKTLAVSLMKIANDIRWLSSGPRSGLGEISIPAVQPGSSIMPGKVNPVIAESVCQVAAQVIGNDCTITVAGQSGNFQLNVMMPVIAYNLIQSVQILTSAIKIFGEKCIDGIQANKEVCNSNVYQSLAMATPLAKVIGYDKTAEITKKAYETGKTVKEIALEEQILKKEELMRILDPYSML